MAKHARTQQTDQPEQLLLFAEHVSLARIRPALNEWRYLGRKAHPCENVR